MDNALLELIEAAKNVRERAHAPYSKFLVGAALLADSGKVYTGCNVENASYGVTICAERSAGCAAIAGGDQHWRSIALVTQGGVSPCGACRQFLCEFAPNLNVVLFDSETDAIKLQTTLAELLPHRFDEFGD